MPKHVTPRAAAVDDAVHAGSFAERGSFAAFLAPLTPETFRQAIREVEARLQVVTQTLSMLEQRLDGRGYDAILDEMLRAITQKIGELLGADRATIFLLDAETQELWSIVARDEHGNNLELRIPASVGIAGEVATSRKALNIPYDLYDDPRSASAKKFDERNNYRTYSMLAMPLLDSRGELLAVVQLINKLTGPRGSAPLAELADRKGFSDADQRVFDELGPSIRLILESSRSFYQATQQQRAASALIQATQSIAQASLDLEDTLARVMHEAKELMHADRATLWLIDREHDQLWTKLPIGGELKEIRIPLAAGFAGQVAASGQPLSIPFDLYEHANAATAKETDLRTGYRTCSMLCMPVFDAAGALIGVTQLVNKRRPGVFPSYDPSTYPAAPDCWKASFNRTDQSYMASFNLQAGVALQKAKLFDTVKQQEQMQRDILRSLSDGVISTDKLGRVIAANEAARALLGLDAHAVLEGRLVNELVTLETGDFARWLDAAREPAGEKSRSQYYPDQTLRPLAGETQHSVNLSINSIADANDPSKVSGVLVVMEDVSDEKRLKSTMYRYMTQELAEQLMENPDAAKMGGDRKEVTVLFSDIRGYTALTEALSAEAVVEMLNHYFESMVDAVFQHKGTLDKYIGDAIMAVFGSPLPLADHEWMAVKTSLEMRHRLSMLNAERRSRGEVEIRIGIGVNSDTVISGNIGSSKRMEFTAIGDGVNLGARLEGASKLYGTDIVLSETTYRPNRDRIWARQLDLIRVKGKTKPVAIYELVGLRSDRLTDAVASQIEIYERGRDFYGKRKFRLAMNEFATIVEEIDSQDRAALLQLERCQHFLQHPPGEEWDGAWSLTEK